MAVHRASLRKLGIAVLTNERASLCMNALVSEYVRFLFKSLVTASHKTLIEGLHSIRFTVECSVSLAQL